MAAYAQIKCSTNRAHLPVLGEQQLVYLLIEIMPAREAATFQVPLNLCFVLDQSGSMKEDNKINCLREGVRRAIDSLMPHDVLSIVAFAGGPKVIVSGQLARDKERLSRPVLNLKAGGGTRLGTALRVGLNELRKTASTERFSCLVMLTDGQTPLEDEPACRSEAERAKKDRVRISALGLGLDWNETLLMELAHLSAGQAGFIQFPTDIDKHLQEIVKTLQGMVIQNAFLTVRMASTVTPRRVWRVAPLISDLSEDGISQRDVQVRLGELAKGQGQGILVECIVLPHQAGQDRIAQVDLSYDVPLMRITNERVCQDISVDFTPDQALSGLTNVQVTNIVEKLTAYRMQTRALDQVRAGDKEGATRLLHQAATLLLHQSETELARTISLEADRIAAGGELSEEGKKTIQFRSDRTIKLG